jgi:hypothetical protein
MMKNNWAIIVGVNQYWKPSVCLKGAVGDAVRVAEWLLKSPECAVPPGNMYLLTSPAPPAPPAGVDLRDATADNLKRVIIDLNKRSGGEGDRLFFYFSGHGISNLENFRNEQALVMTDFDPDLTDKAVKLGPIVEFFGATAIREQFFFIDACRSPALFKFSFETGSTTVKNPFDAVKATKVDQYILYSTTPGSKSLELPTEPGVPGSEEGAFTGALLEGLAGDGTAKAYDPAKRDYVVRVEALMDHVIEKITERRLIVSKIEAAAPLLIQLPRKGGEQSNNNPVLARVAASEVKSEELKLTIEPNSVWPQAEVEVRNEAFVDKRIKPESGDPVILSPLKPMYYTVRATAPDHTESIRSFPLYKRVEVTLTLDPGAVTIETDETGGGTAAAAGAADVVGLGSANAGLKSLDAVGEETEPDMEQFESVGRGAAAPEAWGDDAAAAAAVPAARLIVETSDPLSLLELADSTGCVLRSAQGRLDVADMRPGFYRVRLLTPEGRTVEEVIELADREVVTKRLDAPDPPQTPLFKGIISTANFFIQSDKTLDVSETVGPISSAQLSTILALSLTACNHQDSWGVRLKSLGLKSFKEATSEGADCGLQLVAAVEGADAEEAAALLAGARLRLWPVRLAMPEEGVAPEPLPAAPGVAQFARAAHPGPHWLSIEMPGQRPVIFALSVLPGRLTVLVTHLSATGRARIFQYAPELAPGRFATPAQIRRQEIVQRFYLSGRLEYAYDIAREALLSGVPEDPLLLCLQGYLALKLNHWDDAAATGTRLTGLHPDLSDGYVILGDYLAETGDAASAARAYKTAVQHELPIFAEGLTRLHHALGLRADAEGRGGVDPFFANAAAVLNYYVARRVNGLLWTVWAPDPDDFRPGMPLLANP